MFRSLVTSLVLMLLLAPLTAGDAPGPADASPRAAAVTLPAEPRAALLFAAQAAGLDPQTVRDLAEPLERSPSAEAGYARLAAAAGAPRGTLPPGLPPAVASALVPLLDAATHAVTLRSEALAALDGEELRVLETLDDAYLESRHRQDRAVLAAAWAATGGLPPDLDRTRLAAAAYHLLDAGLDAAPALAAEAHGWPGLATGSGLCVDDGIGLLIVCGPGDDTLTGNHILEIDLGGDDHHATNAGASGLGVLWGGTNGLPAALALDLAGHDVYSGGSQVQGTGATTPGVLIDLEGDDVYDSHARFFNFVQGAGNVGGVGLLYDAVGDDLYRTPFGRVDGDTAWDSQGFGILGGIGILHDALGTDSYTGGAYAQGIGDFDAVGLLLDNEGTDTYDAVRRAQGFGDGAGAGLLLESTGRDRYLIREDEGQGAGIGGTGILVDVSGDDDYAAYLGAAQGWAREGAAWKPIDDVRRLLGVPLLGTAALVDLEGSDRYYGSRGCDLCVWRQGTGVGIDGV